MRTFSLILGIFCLAGCTGTDIVQVQGVVPPLAHAGETGVSPRVPVDVVFAPPADVYATNPSSPQARYDDAVRHGQLKEANWARPRHHDRIGVMRHFRRSDRRTDRPVQALRRSTFGLKTLAQVLT